jgi:hypothetical protein
VTGGDHNDRPDRRHRAAGDRPRGGRRPAVPPSTLRAPAGALRPREYERTLAETSDRRATEAALTEREQRHRDLDIRELSSDERARYTESWATIQRGFVDDPVQSVHHADALVVDIMRTRGYPVDDFERCAEDLSVQHPQVVQQYRDARSIHQATQNGTADTEQQRHAVTSYRALIDTLLGHHDGDPAATNGRHAQHPTTEEHTR